MVIESNETREHRLESHIQTLLVQVAKIKSIDFDNIEKAVVFGKKAHKGQMRKSGDLYFIHPVRVAIKATEYDVDTKTIISALLHDVLEDTDTALEILEENFGNTVANLVNAMTKVKKDKRVTLKKIIKLGHRDFRVILIKLLDRLDNLSDLEYLNRKSQRRICDETVALYSEIAHGLGLIEIEENIRDYIFQHLYPRSYKKISLQIEQLQVERSVAIKEIIELITNHLPTNLVFRISPQFCTTQAFLFSRTEILQVLDYVLIETVTSINCYEILGNLHINFRSIPLSILDFICNPKANGWRGLQTRLIVNGEQVSVYIVTRNYHEKNRKGVITLIREGIYLDSEYQQFLDLYNDIASTDDNVRIEDIIRMGTEKVIQAMTPKGRIVELRYDATILDFAFMVHTELGLHCAGGIINNVRYPNNKIVENGSVVTIITSKSVILQKEWLDFLVMPKARKETLRFFHSEKEEQSASLPQQAD